MSRDYAPKTFLRRTPNVLLKEYFANKGVLANVECDKLGEMEVDPIIKEIDKLTHNDRIAVEADFQRINEMACEAGVQVLVEEGAYPFHHVDLAAAFQPMKSHYERAFWAFLNHPRVFEVASELAFMDRTSTWRRRYVGEGLQPAVLPADLRNLAESLSEFYKKQGRGQHCEVENYLRQKPERHCYFAYPEDYATTDIGYDDQGKLKHWPTRRALEVIFVYHPDIGFLEVSAKGKKEEMEKLQEGFCRVILGLKGLPEDKGKRYDLSSLTDKAFAPVTDAKDGIDEVTLKMLRVELPGMGKRAITFEASSAHTKQPVLDLIEQALNKNKVPLDTVKVTKARLQFKFAPKAGKRGKTLTFEISIPDRCTLRDDALDQIAKKYIERWGFTGG